jgi:hypothetical protein
MVTLANRLKESMGRLGYEYNQSGQFSVEITDKLVIVSEKIDLFPLTKEMDKLSLLFHLSGNRLGGPLSINYLSASLYRYPKHQNSKTAVEPQIIMDANYFAQAGSIPTKEQLYETVAERLNMKSSLTIDMLSTRNKDLFINKEHFMRVRGGF